MPEETVRAEAPDGLSIPTGSDGLSAPSGADALSAAADPDQGEARLIGAVERIIFCNEANGYTVAEILLDDGDCATVCGILPYLAENERVSVYGRWTHSPKYGLQFRADRYEQDLPVGSEAILRYLSSGMIRGVGPKTAQRLVEAFGADTFEVMERYPERLADVRGVSLRKAQAIAEDFRAKSGMRSAMLFFREFFGAAMTVRIYRQYGGNAVEIARRNPYRLCEEVRGVGFERADRLAMSLGLDAESDERLTSGVAYVLTYNATRNGHVCLPRGKLIEAAAELLSADPARVGEAVDRRIADGRLVSRSFGGRAYLYTSEGDRAERYVADKLTVLDRLCPAVDTADVRAFLAREEREAGIVYADRQREAIYGALSHGVMILTGGPGTGKTTVVRALLHIFTSMEGKVALCAPTGRAAKRLSESTSTEARTIHRLLEMEFEEDGASGRFRRCEENLLDENVVIVDEASMVDNALMYALLRAMRPGARLVLIGDADQLPSVGAGRVLNDLVDSGRFSTVRLEEIFRQARESLIVTNAHAINEGRMPTLTARDNDFFFLPRETDREIAQTVAELYGTRLPRAYGEETRDGIQVITPSRKGEAGTENLNRLLQASLNPPAPGKREIRYREEVFRVGDRVMQTRNNYEIAWEGEAIGTGRGNGVFNGDIGRVTDADPSSGELRIRFDDRETVYNADRIGELEHAWAVTVHKSQGSEYPFVIVPMYAAPPLLLTRNLLYTAVTRARRMVILVGREDIVRAMVRNRHESMRYTGLTARLTSPEGGGL